MEIEEPSGLPASTPPPDAVASNDPTPTAVGDGADNAQPLEPHRDAGAASTVLTDIESTNRLDGSSLSRRHGEPTPVETPIAEGAGATVGSGPEVPGSHPPESEPGDPQGSAGPDPGGAVEGHESSGAAADGGSGRRGPAGVRDAGGAGEAPAGPEPDELADPDRLRSAVEAVLLVVDSPTSAITLAQVLGRSVPEIMRALHALRDDYTAGGRGMDLREAAGGWRLYTRDDFAAYVERFVLDGQQARLTQASLETLAVIAYRQPVTRSRISGIRGVSVDAVMRTLLTRGLVEECGADPDTGGGLYRTTQLFLEKMGLRSLDELPSLAPLLPDTSQLDDVELSS
jgi:segregation and condensation protein B